MKKKSDLDWTRKFWLFDNVQNWACWLAPPDQQDEAALRRDNVCKTVGDPLADLARSRNLVASMWRFNVEGLAILRRGAHFFTLPNDAQASTAEQAVEEFWNAVVLDLARDDLLVAYRQCESEQDVDPNVLTEEVEYYRFDPEAESFVNQTSDTVRFDRITSASPPIDGARILHCSNPDGRIPGDWLGGDLTWGPLGEHGTPDGTIIGIAGETVDGITPVFIGSGFVGRAK